MSRVLVARGAVLESERSPVFAG